MGRSLCRQGCGRYFRPSRRDADRRGARQPRGDGAVAGSRERAPDRSLLFANCVDFDTNFGHRRDVSGYANARGIRRLHPTAAHRDEAGGCRDHHGRSRRESRLFPGSDHTREHRARLRRLDHLTDRALRVRGYRPAPAGHLGLQALAARNLIPLAGLRLTHGRGRFCVKRFSGLGRIPVLNHHDDGRRSHGRTMATIKDLVAKVGVSVATVSNVLNDKPERRRDGACRRVGGEGAGMAASRDTGHAQRPHARDRPGSPGPDQPLFPAARPDGGEHRPRPGTPGVSHRQSGLRRGGGRRLDPALAARGRWRHLVPGRTRTYRPRCALSKTRRVD